MSIRKAIMKNVGKMGRGGKRQKLNGAETKTASYAQADDEGSNTPLYPPKLRDCRRCGIKTHNYFTCYRCQCQIRGRNPDAYVASEFEASSRDMLSNGRIAPGLCQGFHRG